MSPKYRHYSIATTVVVLFFLLLPNGRLLLQYLVDDGWKESLTYITDNTNKVVANTATANRLMVKGEERKKKWDGSSWVRHILPGANYGQVYEASVLRVIDGDTIDVQYSGRVERVRFADIDTFETHDNQKMADDVRSFNKSKRTLYKAGVQAKNYVSSVLPTGTKVGLSFSNNNIKRGRYNRLIAYVHMKNGTVLNSILVQRGLAKAYSAGFSGWNRALYKTYEVKARINKTGVWAYIN